MDVINLTKKRINRYRSQIEELERNVNVKIATTFQARYENDQSSIEDILDKQAALSSLCKELIKDGKAINELLEQLTKEESHERDLIRERDNKSRSIDHYFEIDDYKDIIDKTGILNAYKLS